MDNGTKFLKQSFKISAAFDQLLDFLFSSDAPAEIQKDMLFFKEKFDRYRKAVAEQYLNYVSGSCSDKEPKLQESGQDNPINY